jgi:hypothetical protein
MRNLISPYLLALVLFFGCSPKAKRNEAATSNKQNISRSVGENWLFWRGLQGNGVSAQANMPNFLSLEKESLLWDHEIQGGGVPVIAGEELIILVIME